MNELTEFSVVFKTNGADDMQRVLTEINQGLDDTSEAFSGAIKQAGGFGDSVASMASRLTKMATAFFGVQQLISGAFNVNNEILQLNSMADAAGVAAEKIETLAIATREFGGTNESAGSVFTNLSNMMTKISQGIISDEQRLAMARYGVSYMGSNGLANAEEMLYNIAEVMPGLSAGERQDLGKAMGLDRATINYLARGVDNLRRTITEAADKVSLSGDAQRMQAAELANAQLELKKSWDQFLIQITPLLTNLLYLLQPVVDSANWLTGGVRYIFDSFRAWFGGNEDELTVANASNPYVRWKFGDEEVDAMVAAARNNLNAANNPLAAGATYATEKSNYEQSISIGEINIEDKSGTVKGKASALSQEINNALRTLTLSPATLSKSVR